MKKKIKILISFVGTNDAGKLNNKTDGAILTLLKQKKFNEVHLLWTSSQKKGISYDEISQYLEKEIRKRKYSKIVKRHYLNIYNVTNHNEIYPKLIGFMKRNFGSSQYNITAAIASGTPSMQACWLLMAESGDFKMSLIRSNEPQYGKPLIQEVKLSSMLPRIVKLEKSEKEYEDFKKEFIPNITLDIRNSKIKIGNYPVSFTRMEFCYYRYFLERRKRDEEYLKPNDIIELPTEFSEKIIQYYQECFPEYDINIRHLKSKLSKIVNISLSNFRSVISDIKKKIQIIQKNKIICKYLFIESKDPRYSISYGISIPKEKIKIIK